ncbi:cupin domain-containing protein [Herpetosiphon sp. NSE202]|uniref:cupin domain-containing protein n=1 Tax=Herpetosiphon sp. NSE202 TaxID=3351349 RepID=UPI0036412808
MPSVINLLEKFAHFNDYWNPRVIGDLNGQHVKVAKLQGAFEWHHHEHEDELFFVVQGRLRMQLRDGDQVLNQGDMLIVPRGVEHCPVAETEEVWLMMFEPATTLNTGNLNNERTRSQLEQI